MLCAAIVHSGMCTSVVASVIGKAKDKIYSVQWAKWQGMNFTGIGSIREMKYFTITALHEIKWKMRAHS